MSGKEDARKYLQQRAAEPRTPPPTQEEIRRRMGWKLVDAARKVQSK